MDTQTLIAGALVALCSAWAAWMLMPAAARAWCRARLGLPSPAPAAGACGGCSGCGGASGTAGRPQVVAIVRRPRA